VRLTAEEHRETVKRFAHIRPAGKWGSARCGARLSGSRRVCTRELGHRGPHVSHGLRRNVLAVWDDGSPPPKPVRKKVASSRVAERGGLRSGRALEALGAFVRRVTRNPMQFVEESLLLLFALAMVGFVIDWTLRIIGWR